MDAEPTPLVHPREAAPPPSGDNTTADTSSSVASGDGCFTPQAHIRSGPPPPLQREQWTYSPPPPPRPHPQPPHEDLRICPPLPRRSALEPQAQHVVTCCTAKARLGRLECGPCEDDESK